jgi:site-specific recombinase XerD
VLYPLSYGRSVGVSDPPYGVVTTTLDGGSFVSSNKSQATLTEAVELFTLDNQARRFTPATMKFYHFRLTHFVQWCEQNGLHLLSEITPKQIREYLIHLQTENYAGHTIHGAARVVRRFLRFCAEEELIPAAPKFSMPSTDKQLLPSLSLNEFKHILKACQTVRDEAIVLVLLDTGLRASEFVSLDGEHVDLKTGEVTVKQGKGRKDRTVYLGVKARKKTLRYFLKAGTPKPKQAVFRSENTGERLTRNGLYQLLQRLGERAAVPHCNPHTFRRTFALWSLRNGMNIYALQKLMGHSDLTTLLKYLGLTKEDLRDAHEQYGPADNMT